MLTRKCHPLSVQRRQRRNCAMRSARVAIRIRSIGIFLKMALEERKLMEEQIDRLEQEMATQAIRYEERAAAVSRAKDGAADR